MYNIPNQTTKHESLKASTKSIINQFQLQQKKMAFVPIGLLIVATAFGLVIADTPGKKKLNNHLL